MKPMQNCKNPAFYLLGQEIWLQKDSKWKAANAAKEALIHALKIGSN